MSKPPRSTANNGGEKQKVVHDYHDHAHISYPAEIDVKDSKGKRKGAPGGVKAPFPEKLHVMLSTAQDQERGFSHIVSWQPHGRSFIVHKPKDFVQLVMPLFFRQSKLPSFQRQLNLYGFSRITAGRDRGGYYHEYFLRQRLFLCQKICRTRIKGNGIKARASPETEPNFYSMPWLEPEDASSSDRDINEEVTSALEEIKKRVKPPKKQILSRRDGSTKKKKPCATKHIEDDLSYSSPSCVCEVMAPTAVVSLGSPKNHLIPRRSTWAGGNKNPNNLCQSTSTCFNDDLDSLDRYGVELKRNSLTTEHDGIASRPLPLLSESSLSAVQSLHEPLLSPSPSSISLSGMFPPGETLEINPDTFFP